MKTLFRYLMVALFALTVYGDVTSEASAQAEQFVDIPFTNLASESSYSRGLVTLNIAGGSKSNEALITGIASERAVITKVEITGMIRTANMNGRGNAVWYIRHNGTKKEVPLANDAARVSTNAFAGLKAKTTWSIWIEGAPYSTVKGGSIRVYYTD